MISVYTTKIRLKHVDTSSDSELNEVGPRRRHHQHHYYNPELYYEERWIERRTRRRANRRRLSRQDSRSFSEEELRHSKSSSTAKARERQRRALSENARYEGDEGTNESDYDTEDDIIKEKGTISFALKLMYISFYFFLVLKYDNFAIAKFIIIR